MIPRLVLCFVVAGCTSSWDGAKPVLSSVAPNPICDAQADVALTLGGTGFSVEVLNTLTNPTVVLPTVFLIDPTASAASAPSFTSAPDPTGETLAIVVQGLAPATYDVEVVDPNEDGMAMVSGGATSSTLTASLTVDPPPDLASVMPAAAAATSTTTVTLTGSAFSTGMAATLEATPPIAAATVTVSADATTAIATFDLGGTATGTYAITVDNHDGCTSTLPGAFQAL